MSVRREIDHVYNNGYYNGMYRAIIILVEQNQLAAANMLVRSGNYSKAHVEQWKDSEVKTLLLSESVKEIWNK